jgi:hypothetical protein
MSNYTRAETSNLSDRFAYKTFVPDPNEKNCLMYNPREHLKPRGLKAETSRNNAADN